MKNSLDEVDISGGVKRPGGVGHEKALEELRKAQIELAKAWARSEGDDEADGQGDDSFVVHDDAHADSLKNKGSVDGEGGSADEKESVSGSTMGLEGSRLEEETDKDIELSRKRREANDRYFKKVNDGVLAVVNKLEEVAAAMKGVELESKEIWGNSSDGVETESTKTRNSAT